MSKTITLSDESINLIRSALIEYRMGVEMKQHQWQHNLNRCKRVESIRHYQNLVDRQKEIFDDLTFLLEETFPYEG